MKKPDRRLLATVLLTAAMAPAFTCAQDAKPTAQMPNTQSGPATRAAPARVDALPGEPRADSATSARIRGAIESDPALRGTDISVHTNQGVVSLNGTVQSREQSAIASAHAQREDGVLRVDNDLALPIQ
jgi:hyperosmotically inducible periplasmic protein